MKRQLLSSLRLLSTHARPYSPEKQDPLLRLALLLRGAQSLTQQRPSVHGWDGHALQRLLSTQPSGDRSGREEEEDAVAEAAYHRAADELLERLQDALEVLVEDAEVEGGDVEHGQGVLTLRLGDRGTYVINKQTPNRQVWMSSPVSGPVRYDRAGGRWVYRRDGHDLLERLSAELASSLSREVDLGADAPA